MATAGHAPLPIASRQRAVDTCCDTCLAGRMRSIGRVLNHAFDDCPVANLNRMHSGLFIFVKTKTHEIAFDTMVIIEIIQ